MNHRRILSLTFATILLLALAACGARANGNRDGSTDGSSDAFTGDGSNDPGATLPCDVANLLTHYCVSCHSPGSTAAPMPLVTISDLTRPSLNNPAITVAQACLNRMRNTVSPMPPAPAPAVPAAEVTAFETWVTGGMQPGNCGSLPTDPLNAAPTCTSGNTWSYGNAGSASMNPGQPCIACHNDPAYAGDAPGFLVAGTVYPTGHEPDNCGGITSSTTDPVEIEITDANGMVYQLFSNVGFNMAGNFYLTPRRAPAFATPYTARVLYQGRERRMNTPQTDGDCNGCHTDMGANGAPGRVTVPGM